MTFIKVFNKNFKPWTDKLLAYTIGSSNKEIASIYAKWNLNYDLSGDQEETTDLCRDCSVHSKSSLTKKQWIAFLKDKCSTASRGDPMLLKHTSAIKLLSGGADLYNLNQHQLNHREKKLLKDLQEDVEKYFFIQAHITQSTERGVQETAICSQNQKGENDTTSLVAIRSLDLTPVYEVMRKNHTIKYKRGNQHVSSGTNETRTHRSPQAIRNHQAKKDRHRLIPTKEKAIAHIQH